MAAASRRLTGFSAASRAAVTSLASWPQPRYRYSPHQSPPSNLATAAHRRSFVATTSQSSPPSLFPSLRPLSLPPSPPPLSPPPSSALITVDCASALSALPPTVAVSTTIGIARSPTRNPLASSPSPAPSPPAPSLQPPSPRSRHRSRSPTALSPSSHLRQRAAPSWPRHRHAPYPPPSARRRGVLLAARRDHAVQRTSLGCADTPRATVGGVLFAGASVPLSASSVHARRAVLASPLHTQNKFGASDRVKKYCRGRCNPL